jgi:hypothetical protein
MHLVGACNRGSTCFLLPARKDGTANLKEGESLMFEHDRNILVTNYGIAACVCVQLMSDLSGPSG